MAFLVQTIQFICAIGHTIGSAKGFLGHQPGGMERQSWRYRMEIDG